MSDAVAPSPAAPSGRYSAVAIALHWIIAILLVGMVFYGWWMEDLRDALRAGDISIGFLSGAYNWHKTVGITILVLSLARLAWRLSHKPPALPEHMKSYEKFFDSFPILFLNELALPKLPVPQTEGFRGFAGSAHGAGGWVILVLLAIHAGGALKHHFLDRDGVLLRMIPGLNLPKQDKA